MLYGPPGVGIMARTVHRNPKCDHCLHFDRQLAQTGACVIGEQPSSCGEGDHPTMGFAPFERGGCFTAPPDLVEPLSDEAHGPTLKAIFTKLDEQSRFGCTLHKSGATWGDCTCRVVNPEYAQEAFWKALQNRTLACTSREEADDFVLRAMAASPNPRLRIRAKRKLGAAPAVPSDQVAGIAKSEEVAQSFQHLTKLQPGTMSHVKATDAHVQHEVRHEFGGRTPSPKQLKDFHEHKASQYHETARALRQSGNPATSHYQMLGLAHDEASSKVKKARGEVADANDAPAAPGVPTPGEAPTPPAPPKTGSAVPGASTLPQADVVKMMRGSDDAPKPGTTPTVPDHIVEAFRTSGGSNFTERRAAVRKVKEHVAGMEMSATDHQLHANAHSRAARKASGHMEAVHNAMSSAHSALAGSQGK